MKLKFSFLLALLFCVGLGFFVSRENTSTNQLTRTVSYGDRLMIDESCFEEFDEHEIIETEEGIDIIATKEFDMSLLEGLDLVGLDETQESFNVRYEVNYVTEEDTVFLTVLGESAEEFTIVDTIPGLVSFNEAGEEDIMFSVDGETVWLSDLEDTDALDETGWFKSLIKKVTKSVTKVASAVVKALAPIIKPVVKVTTYLVVKLIGPKNAAAWGAKALNMSADANGVYHANFNCWQQYFGYTDLYDTVFDAGTSMRNAKFDFDVNGDGKMDYILWAWKGNYLSLGAGAELGIYQRWSYSDVIWKVNKNLAMKMTLKLTHKGTTVADWKPTAKQWWITAFNPKVTGSKRDNLSVTYTVTFNNANMYNAFKTRWQARDARWKFSSGYTATFTF